MSPISVSLFKGLTNVVTCQTLDFKDFSTFLTEFAEPLDHSPIKDKLFGYLWLSAKVRTRRKQSISEVTTLVLDFDQVQNMDLVAEVLHQAQTKRLAFWAHSSWSHTPEKPKFRLVLGLSEPVPAEYWSTFVDRALAFLDFPLVADPVCHNPAQVYFLPQYEQDTPVEHHWRMVDHGQVLDVPTVMGPTPFQTPPKESDLSHCPAGVPASFLPSLGNPTPLTLTGLRSHCRTLRKGNPEQHALAGVLNAMLEGEVWAPDGERYQTLKSVAGSLATLWFQHPASQFLGYFSAALSHPRTDPTAKPWTQVWTGLYNYAAGQQLAKVYAQHQAAQAPALDPEEAHATAGGPPHGAWIVQYKQSYYPWTPEAPYALCYTRDEGLPALRRALKNAPIEWTKLTSQGNPSPKTLPEVMHSAGAWAQTLRYSLVSQESSFDPSFGGQLNLASAPRKQVKPVFNQAVSTWFELLAGDKHPEFCQWIASLWDLSKPVPILFLYGPGGVGKSLLAKACSGLWRKGDPVLLKDALGDWFPDTKKTPFIFGDESIPKDFRGLPKTEELMELVQAYSRPIKEKYMSDVTVDGYVRILVAANRGDVFGAESFKDESVNALAERVLLIHPGEECQAYLKDVGAARCQDWLDQGTIASHLAWISTRPEYARNPALRWGIQPDLGEVVDRLKVETIVNNALLHWFWAWLGDPERITAGAKPRSAGHRIFVEEGRIWTNSSVLTEFWEAYPVADRNRRFATLKSLAPAFEGLREAGLPHQVMRGGHSFQVWALRTDLLVAWASQFGVAAPNEVLARLAEVEGKQSQKWS
jgi:hypothetical protein